jgi:predicted enzyme related to lactoylglutathione lyase
MHRSRLAGFIIDCKTDDLDGAADFWSAALGYPKNPSDDPAESSYVKLETGKGGLHIEVQQVSHPSRLHLDIEADDIDAEVARLEKLGAKRLENIRTWVVMEAPTGQRFCVVRPQRGGFEQQARVWKDPA